MFRYTFLGLAALTLAASTAAAGNVTFDPQAVDLIPGDQVSLDVTLEATEMASFDALMAVFQTEYLTIDGFTIDSALIDTAVFPPFVEPVPGGGLSIGAFLPDSVQTQFIGSLQITVPETIPFGYYRVFVDSGLDNLSELTLGAGSEGLVGEAVLFVVIPEPATVTLLGLGALCLFRRR